MMDLHIHTAMFNCMTFHNHRVAQFEIMPHLQQMYALFHAQNCFDMGFTTLRDLGMNGPLRPAGERDVRGARLDQRRHRRRPAHADRRLHDHDRLASRSDPAARDVPLRLQHRRRPVGAAQARAHEPARGLRRDQDLRVRRRRHRQGRAGHPQHDAGGARRDRRRGARPPQARGGALLHHQRAAHGDRRPAPTRSSTWCSTTTRRSS